MKKLLLMGLFLLSVQSFAQSSSSGTWRVDCYIDCDGEEMHSSSVAYSREEIRYAEVGARLELYDRCVRGRRGGSSGSPSCSVSREH